MGEPRLLAPERLEASMARPTAAALRPRWLLRPLGMDDAVAINERGEVAGNGNLKGDPITSPSHALLWKKDRLHDLRTGRQLLATVGGCAGPSGARRGCDRSRGRSGDG
jgi:hypothetical protein